VFALTPLMFAFEAFLTEIRALLLEIADDDKRNRVPYGLKNMPLIGPWAATRWQASSPIPELC
jgi:hypothetical protein